MTEGYHDVHLVMPNLGWIFIWDGLFSIKRDITDVGRTGHYSPQFQHIDDKLEAVADDKHTDDDEEDRPHHHLSLLPLAQIVQPFVPSS